MKPKMEMSLKTIERNVILSNKPAYNNIFLVMIYLFNKFYMQIRFILYTNGTTITYEPLISSLMQPTHLSCVLIPYQAAINPQLAGCDWTGLIDQITNGE